MSRSTLRSAAPPAGRSVTWLAAILTAAGALSWHPPAATAGSVSLTLTPREETARAIRGGLKLYDMVRSLKNKARVDQRGTGNGAAIAQNGRGNSARIIQRGNGHSGQIVQNGDNNAYALFQFGKNGHANVAQNGNGRVGLTLQGNW